MNYRDKPNPILPGQLSDGMKPIADFDPLLKRWYWITHRPRLKKTGCIWQCVSPHPFQPGCICLSMGDSARWAYTNWRRHYSLIVESWRLRIHPNSEV